MVSSAPSFPLFVSCSVLSRAGSIMTMAATQSGWRAAIQRAPPAIPNGHGFVETQLLDHVRDIIRIGRNGIRCLGLVTLTVPDRLRNTQLS